MQSKGIGEGHTEQQIEQRKGIYDHIRSRKHSLNPPYGQPFGEEILTTDAMRQAIALTSTRLGKPSIDRNEDKIL